MITEILPALQEQAAIDVARTNAATETAQTRFVEVLAAAVRAASFAADQLLAGSTFVLHDTNSVTFASGSDAESDRDIPWDACSLYGELVHNGTVVADARWHAIWSNARTEQACPVLTVSVSGRFGVLGRLHITRRVKVTNAAELAAALAKFA